MEKKRIYLSCPTMHGEEQKYVQEAFDTNWVAPLGPNVNEFEKSVAVYTGSKAAAALSAGTAAIHLALKLTDVKEGDIVFVSDLTFSATCNPICYEKAIPVFIDSEPDTWNMDPKALKKAFEKYPNPKAVVCVHLYGTPAKIDELMAICEEYNVPFVEDLRLIAARLIGRFHLKHRFFPPPAVKFLSFYPLYHTSARATRPRNHLNWCSERGESLDGKTVW